MAGIDNNMDLSMDLIDFSSIDSSKLEGISEEAIITDEEVQEQAQLEQQQDDNTESENSEIVGSSQPSEPEEVGTETPANSDDNVFKSLTDFLGERGLFTFTEDDVKNIKDEDTFAEFMQAQIKASEYADLTDSQITMLEAIREGVSEDVVLRHLQANQAYNELTDEVVKSNADIRKDLIIQGYLAKGFNQEFAEKKYKIALESGDDVEEAIVFRNDLKKIQDDLYAEEIAIAQKAKEDEAKSVKQRLTDLKDSVYNTDKFMGTFPTTKGLKEKVYNLMTKPVAYTPEGHPVNAIMKAQLENPVEFQTAVSYLFELTNGFKDLSKLERKAVSQVTKTFKTKLEQSNFNSHMNANQNGPLTTQEDVNIPKIVSFE
jgi:hypothetical protein